MYHDNDIKAFEKYILGNIACNFRSETSDIFSFINRIGFDKEKLTTFTDVFENHSIPYMLEETDQVVITYLEQYDRKDKNAERALDKFHDDLFMLEYDHLGGRSVNYDNVNEFEEINLGDRRSIFFIDTFNEEDAKNITKHTLDLDIEFFQVIIKEDKYQIDGLSWFILEEYFDRNKPGVYKSYTLLCALLDSGIQHFKLNDSHGDLKVDVRIKTKTDSRSSVHKFRNDLKQPFRSTWEANIARILNFLDIDWEYEKNFFQSETGAYLPDFWLPNNNILEIKGFWDTESLKKVSWFKEHVKDFNLFILDSDFYYDLSRLYSSKITHWEEGQVNLSKETVSVVGVNRPERKKYVAKIKEGSELTLLRDPTNNYDRNAIIVVDSDQNQIGFISKEWAAVYADKMDAGVTYKIVVKEKQPKAIYVDIARANIEQTVVYPFLENIRDVANR